MGEVNRASTIRWWALAVAGMAAALLIAWLGRITGVPLRTLLSIGAGAAALAWLIVLVAGPWNLYFAARQVSAEMLVSRERGIVVAAGQEAEARRIARRMLWFALGGHIATAVAAGLITYFSGATAGYYVAGTYLLSAVIRPAVAYFSHLRDRIRALSWESAHPADDVMTLKATVARLAGTVKELGTELRQAKRDAADDLDRVRSTLAADISHTRQLLITDLTRIADAQGADRDAARSRDEDLGRRIDQMVRRVEATLDGISDHQELLTGIRALVKMIRTDPS